MKPLRYGIVLVSGAAAVAAPLIACGAFETEEVAGAPDADASVDDASPSGPETDASTTDGGQPPFVFTCDNPGARIREQFDKDLGALEDKEESAGGEVAVSEGALVAKVPLVDSAQAAAFTTEPVGGLGFDALRLRYRLGGLLPLEGSEYLEFGCRADLAFQGGYAAIRFSLMNQTLQLGTVAEVAGASPVNFSLFKVDLAKGAPKTIDVELVVRADAAYTKLDVSGSVDGTTTFGGTTPLGGTPGSLRISCGIGHVGTAMTGEHSDAYVVTIDDVELDVCTRSR